MNTDPYTGIPSQLSDDEISEAPPSHFEELSSDDNDDSDNHNISAPYTDSRHQVTDKITDEVTEVSDQVLHDSTVHYEDIQDVEEVEGGELDDADDADDLEQLEDLEHSDQLEQSETELGNQHSEPEDVDSESESNGDDDGNGDDIGDISDIDGETQGANNDVVGEVGVGAGSDISDVDSDENDNVNGQGSVHEPHFVQSQSPESDALQVIELDSEDEIENLEEDDNGETLKETLKETVKNHDLVLNGIELARKNLDSDAGSDLSGIDSDEEPEKQEASISDPIDEKYVESVKTEVRAESKSKKDSKTDVWLITPIIISVTGDKLLLVPHFNDPSVKDMISLFSVDEVASCSLHDLFQLLRSGDLIDAYSFHAEDELKIDVPQMNLSFTEDNIHTRHVKLVDLIDTFNQLRRAESTLTLHLTTQKRFISQFKFLTGYRGSDKSLADLLSYNDRTGSYRHDMSLPDSDGPTKKRRLS